MRGSLSRLALLAAAGVVMASAANAASLDVTGFVRFEPAVKITDEENPHNEYGIALNGRTVTRDASLLGGPVTPCVRTEPCFAVFAPPAGSAPGLRPATGKAGADNEFNMFAGRAEVDFTVNVSEQITLYTKLRAFGQPNVFDEFGDPDFFGTELWSNHRGSLLEVNGDNYMVDLPAMYIDYNNGPLWIRAGNQTIAWGESLFFRVLDVPNGLDLRRHLVLDVGAEEFSDKRVPAPSLRSSYRLTDTIEVEGFVKLFNPTILPNPNTPYNLVSSQFVLHEREFADDRWAADAGGRVQAQFGDLGLQAIAVNRKNPDGVVKWATTNINPGDLLGPGSGGLLAMTPFEPNPQGVSSALGFLHGANKARLDTTIGGSNAVIDFAAAQFLGAFSVPCTAGPPPPAGPCGAPLAASPQLTQTSQLFDLFFQLLGPLKGHVERVYERENIFGFGANYLIRSDNDYLDQLVLRAEASITPNKKFTNNLDNDFIEEDEIAAALVAEKYHRFSQAFPATFFVTQYLFKSDSDIFGRHLQGHGGSDSIDGGTNHLPTGVDNSHYFVFAFQQPFPSLVWRADFALLYDIQGGAQIQPGLRWKPREQYTVELYANILESNGGNDDFAETIEWADEIFLRASYLF